MDSDVPNRIEALVLAKQHLKPLDNQRREWLQEIRLNKDLEPLRREILTRSAFAEQEALVCELTDLTSWMVFQELWSQLPDSWSANMLQVVSKDKLQIARKWMLEIARKLKFFDIGII